MRLMKVILETAQFSQLSHRPRTMDRGSQLPNREKKSKASDVSKKTI